MKSYDEQTNTIRKKLTAKRKLRRRNITATISMVCCIVLIAGVCLTVPRDQSPNSSTYPTTVNKPLSQDYTQLVNVLKTIQANKGDLDGSDLIYDVTTDDAPSATPDSSENESIYGDSGSTEITDHQVAGVNEADIIKRSNDHIFYLSTDALKIYSVAGEHSKQVGFYDLSDGFWLEMYLSEDCSTVTVIGYENKCTKIINLDVSHPEYVSVIGEMSLSGNYNSARYTGGYLYLYTSYYLNHECDYTDPGTFLPQYSDGSQMTELTMDDIVICQNPQSPMYSVITRLDPRSLEMMDTLALLGYNGHLYVSRENIYLTRGYLNTTTKDTSVTYQYMTEISRIHYATGELKLSGCIQIPGRLRNQYSLDEKDGILRAVTTVQGHTGTMQTVDGYELTQIIDIYTNASLFCIDFDKGDIVAKVEHFAPKGEQVQSVRFDGDKAYVCTSIQLSDPVFCFDLSDLSNITWKDTGTIEGFSSSLVNMGNGFLLGIGRGSSWDTVKIEIYQEGQSTMDPYCSYEVQMATISSNYKSYYIDRENQLIGLGINKYNLSTYSSSYLLLHFDGTDLIEIANTAMNGSVAQMRGVYIDGWFYMFGDEFKVIPIR